MDVAVTVYNGQLALVRDVRQVALGGGDLRLQFSDIASTVNPATVHVRSLTDPSALRVLEQNYEYDLLDPQKLLQKYVGREVTLVRATQVNGTTRMEEVKATLLALNGAPVWKIGDEIVTGLPTDHFRFPELPANLYSRPTLVWMLDNRGAAKQRLEVSYLAGGLTWNADYVLTVARDDRAADLDGWVTLGNTSGTAYRNARLQLVAGDLHRVMSGRDGAMQAKRALMAAEAAAPRVLRAGGVLRVPPLHARAPHLDREPPDQADQPALGDRPPHPQALHRRGAAASTTTTRSTPARPIKDTVKVYYTFKNDEASGLGMPLPAGTVRVYQADSKGGVQFIGEDRIDHTPKDETLTLQVGSAFDVVCERKQTDFRNFGRHLGDGVRDHLAQPQDDAHHRRGERAHRRRLGDAVVDPQVDEDRGVGRAVRRARGRGRRGRAEVPGEDAVSQGPEAGGRRLRGRRPEAGGQGSGRDR